jgi:glycosyltransferase involved in cell wall biosynthesis
MNLSIIVPVYNCASYLEIGFNKLKPLYKMDIHFEIIYVNDGSTDDSLIVLEKIKKQNSNIVVLSQENQGSSGARNTAIDVAKGEYIQFLDSDDIIDVDELIILLKRAKKNKLDLIGFRLDYIDENYKTIGVRKKQSVPHSITLSGKESLIEGYQPSSICVFLFEKKLLVDNDLRITPNITHMDVEFMTRVMLNAKRVMFFDEIIYHYLQRSGSITKPTSKTKLEQLLKDEIIIAKLIKNNITLGMDKQLITTIEKNYNSVVWNLLWRFLSKPDEVDTNFVKLSFMELEKENLYPIKGSLKTFFQVFSTFFLNNRKFYFLLLKFKSFL